MLELIKKSLRITTDAFDNELTMMMRASEFDLGNAGIKVDEKNELIQQAIILYCKIYFGRKQDVDMARLMTAYEALKISLSLAGDYID